MINNIVTVPKCAAGTLSTTAPEIAPFTAVLTGVTQTVRITLGAWTVTDARSTPAGYTVTASATAPTVGGSVADAGTGAQLALTPAAPAPAAGNVATGPVVTGEKTLGPTATTIAGAAPGAGGGGWVFPADLGAATGSLRATIPGDAGAGAFHSTLTFTVAPIAP
jgi:hypothetical protein